MEKQPVQLALADIIVRSNIVSANALNGQHFGVGTKKKKELRTSAKRNSAFMTKYRQTEKDGRIMAVCIRYAQRAMDTDNQARGMKPILDGLKLSGVIMDDNPKRLVSVYIHQKAAKKEAECQRVILLRIEDGLSVFGGLVRGHSLPANTSVDAFLLHIAAQVPPSLGS